MSHNDRHLGIELPPIPPCPPPATIAIVASACVFAKQDDLEIILVLPSRNHLRCSSVGGESFVSLNFVPERNPHWVSIGTCAQSHPRPLPLGPVEGLNR
ncbi:hypothetical protein GQ53DRAFT_242995 [Thozetella sp. PMI_491]|nr:hypothetical protein GQ53DRAFT_242995 [Thozetella sp. PMI_491]